MPSRYNRAFTLIEVLITVAILSTSIIFLFRSFTASLSAARFSQNITIGCYLAEDKLWETEYYYSRGLRLEEPSPMTLQNKDFTWKREISDTDNEYLKQLDLTVSWKENVRENEYAMEFTTDLVSIKQ